MKAMHLMGPAPYYTNCYLLISDAGNAVIIDPAVSAAQADKVLEEQKAHLTHILLTHGHFDHVYGLEELRSNHPDAKLYMCAEDALGNDYYPPKEFDVALEDGDVVKADEMEFKVYRTPGHTPGSCCFLCRDMFFTGDTLFHLSIGRTDLPGGDFQQMSQSLAKLRDLPIANGTQVLPGHADFSTMGEEKACNPYLQTMEEF